MTPEQINIAIAEYLGWTLYKGQFMNEPQWSIMKGEIRMIHPSGVPNYAGELNAMHEAVKQLNEHQQSTYAQALFKIVFGGLQMSEGEYSSVPSYEFNPQMVFALSNASAIQRAEAFLRTVEKWIESTKS